MSLHILLARQRSGTGVLNSVINAHPEISCVGELFHPNEISHKNNYFNFLLQKIRIDPTRALPGANETNYQEFMAHIKSLAYKKNIFIDVKYSSTHHFNDYWHSTFDMPKFLQLCKKDQRKILHLKRRNYLKTYISGRLAEQNKIWHTQEKSAIKITSLILNETSLLNYLRSTTRQVNNFDGYLRKYAHVLELEYEELFQENGLLSIQIAEKIADFLEVERKPFETVSPTLIKQTSNNLAAVIENIDEITIALNKTEFSWMLQ